ncbi:helix-turn-helix domain-containing protein [Paraburkholderia guartelaensis]|jgi:cytoskeleton protein RodZ|uniref:Helix-turn-helix domain-containing protein n=1 Tax=Paraburkholderia guartelaensis TaxID=2546446 RepID=A0A4R5LIZ4_9BURK|nr:helix-turn-helix domain-containing protein [Paraburkholderia guartelaensis]TDG09508.1 helix-turn-helix domain-containing protein [Paraburkholderia guartelaensis]
MSEPQHPFGTDGTDSNAGRSAPGATPSPVQAVPDTMAAAGARLAQLREAKGWAIEDVSARLKVSVSKLRELEAGDISHLPDTTFALGVVRAYAKLLGTDSTPFTQALRRERGMAQPDLSMPASAGSDLPRGRVSLSLGGSGARAPRRRASWLWGVAIIVIAVLAISMWHTNSGESSAWFARLKAMANGASVQTGASSPTVTQGVATGNEGASAVQGADQSAAPQAGDANDAGDNANANAAPDQDATASAPQAAQPAPQAAQPAPQAAQPAPQAAKPAAASAAPAAAVANAASAARAQAASAPAAAAAQAAAADNGADTSTFAIRVTQDTWVNVRQKDGKEVFSGLIHGSDAREITGTEPLKVTVGNKAGIESMTIDGQPVDTSKYASARGNVARFVLP